MSNIIFKIRKIIFRLNKLIVFPPNLFYPLCRIKVIKKNRVFDKFLKISYEINSDIGDALYFKGVFEKRELKLLTDLIDSIESPVIFDIGANIGLHSIAFANSNTSSMIYSFEPSIITSEILKKNIKIKEIENQINFFDYALSDHLGKASFFHTDDNAYSSLKDTKRKKIVNTIEVVLMTIDEFVKRESLRRLDLVKIDVEGLDTEVIKGGIFSFQKFKPEIFIEIYKGVNSNPNPVETINLLKEIGYKVFVIIDGKINPYYNHSDKYYNYLFSYKDQKKYL